MMDHEKSIEHLTVLRDYIFKMEENLSGHCDSDVCMIVNGLLCDARDARDAKHLVKEAIKIMDKHEALMKHRQ